MSGLSCSIKILYSQTSDQAPALSQPLFVDGRVTSGVVVGGLLAGHRLNYLTLPSYSIMYRNNLY